MDPRIGQVTVHAVDLGQVGTAANRADIHLQFLVTAVIAVRQRQVYTFVIPFLHGTFDQGPDRFDVITYRIPDILDLAAIKQVPKTAFLILFFNRADVFRYMAVKTVADIRTIRNAFYDPEQLAELLYTLVV